MSSRHSPRNSSPLAQGVLITSVYNLPSIPIRHKNSSFTSHGQIEREAQATSRRNVLKNKILKTETSQPINYQKSRLHRIFKEKFYEDVQNNYDQKLKKKKLFTDKILQNQIIHMKKVANFWKCFSDYTTPIFTMEKFKLNSENDYSDYRPVLTEVTSKPAPKVYKSYIISEMIHNKKVEKERKFYENLKRLEKAKVYK